MPMPQRAIASSEGSQIPGSEASASGRSCRCRPPGPHGPKSPAPPRTLGPMTLGRFLRRFAGAVFSVVALGLVASVGGEPVRGALRATELRCEWAIDPLGLGEPAPRLTWIVESSRRGERQSAYRVLVATTPEALEADRGDLWESGRVDQSQSRAVYAGAPLRSGTICHWKVMAWDRDGVPGPWSAPARWEMGLMEHADWVAAWIDAASIASEGVPPVRVLRAIYLPAAASSDESTRSADVTAIVASAVARGEAVEATNEFLGGDPAPDIPKRLVVEYELDGATLRREVAERGSLRLDGARLPLLRRTFSIDRPIRSARLHATALGVYEAFLNGTRVGDLALAPGWTDYRKRVDRQSYDVTALLREGDNVLGALVAPGWFSGRAGLFHARAFYGTAPAFAGQLEILFEDGSTERIATDADWRRRPGPILSADIMDGETYDARAEVDDWCSPEGVRPEDPAWTAVVLRDESRNVESSIDHVVRPLLELPALSVRETAPERYTFDLGQNMVGVARLRLREPAGTVVTVRHAEILAPDGTIDTSNLRGAAAIDRYVCRGADPDDEDAFEVWQPRFTFHGFRYVELSGVSSAPLDAVTGIVIGSDLPATGSFRCSDPLLTRLHENIVWGLRGNALSIPTDCPQRDERMGWSGDVQAFVPTGTLIADMNSFLEKWLVDLADAQREDGAHSDVAPVMRGLAYGSPGWGDAGTIVPWTLYRRTGDVRILERHIDGMIRWVDWCQRESVGLLRTKGRGNDYGDWLAIDAPTSKELIGSAFFAHSADCTAKALRALGRDDDAARYGALFERSRAAFAAAYIDAEGRIKGDTQTAYALALRFDLVPTALRDRAVQHLVEAIEARGGRLSTGFLGSGHLLPVLDEGGRCDVALSLLLERDWPSWLFPVHHGATTIWERWDGWTRERGAHPDISMNSFNHFAFGSCGEWIYSGVAGIAQAPDDAGFARVVLRPRVDGPLVAVDAEHRSVRGRIASSWRRRGSDLSLEVSIPANVVATVILPAGPDCEPRESGTLLADVEGVTVGGRSADAVTLEIGSGEYAFTSTIAARTSGNPIFEGRYADPEVVLVDGRCWIYPTTSAPYDQQRHLDAFSSTDLVHWTRHPRVLEETGITWLRRALWAPSVIEKDGRFYLFFSANDIQKDGELGGIGVAVADRPEGPFRDFLGRPLVGAFHNGAQPIDPFVFRDEDGAHYLLYGGWGRCNIARLRDDFTGFQPFDDGTLFRDITPEGYVEGPCMFRRDGRIYFMWSEGGWTGPDYAVAYATAAAPTGPFVRAVCVLEQDPSIATGAGHHSVLPIPGSNERVIVYHRRPLGMTDRNDREVCMDALHFDAEGRILPVRMTNEGVPAVDLGASR